MKNNNLKFRWLYLVGFFIILALPLLNLQPWFSPPDWGKTIVFRIILSILILIFLREVLSKKQFAINPFEKLRASTSLPFWLLLSLFGIFFLATIFSQNMHFSLWGNPYRSGGFVNFAFYIIFAILTFLILRKEDWKKIWNFNIVIGILVSTIAIFQQFGIFSNIFIPAATEISSTIGGPIFLGIYLLLLIFLTLSFGLKEKNLKKKIFYFISLFIFIFVILLTGSQAAYLGLVFGLFYFLFFYPKKIVLFKILGGVLIILGLFGVYFLKTHPDLSLRKNYIIQNIVQWKIDLSRISSWKISLKALKDKPLLGYGPENYPIAFDKFYDPSLPGLSSSWWDRAHNFIFDIGVTAGIPALIIYLSLFGVLFFRLQKKKRKRSNPIICHGIQATFLAYLAANFFSFDTFSSYLISFLFISFSLALISEDIPEKNFSFNIKGKDLIISLLLFGSIWLIWSFNIRPLQINKEIKIARYQAKNGDYQGALNRMETLLGSHTFLDHYLRLNYIDIINECLEKSSEPVQELLAQKAIKILKENVKIRPLYTRNWLLLGNYTNVLIEKGRRDFKTEANYYFEKANELSPKRQEVFIGWLKTDFLTGDYSKAKEKAQKCINLDPGSMECWWLIGLSNIYLDKIEEAQKNIETASRLGYSVNAEFSLLQLVNVYTDVKNHQELLKIYPKLIAKRSNNPQYHASLAVVYKELGDFENAKKEALIALELMPEAKEQIEEFLKGLE